MSFFLAPLIATGLANIGAGAIGGGALIIGPALNGITLGTVALSNVLSAVITLGESVALPRPPVGEVST